MPCVFISQSGVDNFVKCDEITRFDRQIRLCYIDGTLLKGGAHMAEPAMMILPSASTWSDIRTKKIPNLLITVGLAFGIA